MCIGSIVIAMNVAIVLLILVCLLAGASFMPGAVVWFSV